MQSHTILDALAHGRLPDELIELTFEYVVCRLALPVTLEVSHDCMFSNVASLSRHLLRHPAVVNDHLLAIMEEALLATQEHLLVPLLGRPAAYDLDQKLPSAQLRRIRYVEFEVAIDWYPFGHRMDRALFAARNDLHEILAMSTRYLSALQWLRLTVNVRYPGRMPSHAGLTSLRGRQKQIVSRLIAGFESSLQANACKLRLRYTFAESAVMVEEQEVDLHLDGEQAVLAMRRRPSMSVVRSWALSILVRLSGSSSAASTTLAELHKLSSHGNPSPRISSTERNVLAGECEAYTYYDGFSASIITSPLYIRGGTPSAQATPSKLQKFEPDEIDARFVAAGGFIPPRQKPTLTRLDSHLRYPMVLWPAGVDKANIQLAKITMQMLTDQVREERRERYLQL